MLCYSFMRNTSLSDGSGRLSIPLEAKCITDKDLSRKFIKDKFLMFRTFQKYNPSQQQVSGLWFQICVRGGGEDER
jgi:hypothetical protein